MQQLWLERITHSNEILNASTQKLSTDYYSTKTNQHTERKQIQEIYIRNKNFYRNLDVFVLGGSSQLGRGRYSHIQHFSISIKCTNLPLMQNPAGWKVGLFQNAWSTCITS